MAVWSSTSRLRVIRGTNDFSGGLNTGIAALDIKDNESTDEFGLDTDNHPTATTRKGRSAYGATGTNQTNLLANYGVTHMVRSVGTALQYNSAGTTWTAIAGAFTDTDWDFTNFNSRLIMANGTDEVKSWNGSALSNLNVGVAPTGSYITNDTNRVWIAKNDILYWSKFLDETNWTATEDAGNVQYYTANGGNITAIRRFYDRITVFKKNSMAEIQGKNYFNFALVEISNEIGCTSFKTLVEVQGAMFWMDQNDVYMYAGGRPVAIGQKIRYYLNNLNTSQLARCCAYTDGIRYYLCLVTGANTQPNIRLVYDPRYKIWRIVALSENYRYGLLFNNLPYVGSSAGLTYLTNTGTTDDGTAISWSITSKPYQDGLAEAENEYYAFHSQIYLPSGSTAALSVSTDDRSTSFTTVDTFTTSTTEQSTNQIIPLDTVAITNFFRYRLAGTGPVEINQNQRMSREQPVQL